MIVDEKRLKILGDKAEKLTSSQKQAILSSGKVLVSAAAGSGKTSTMLDRIMVLIAEGASLKNTLILVYNEVAARELKERLYTQLFDYASSTGDEHARDAYLKALDELPFCHVSTTHAFCQSMIRQNFDKLGISPSFEVLDESAHAVYMNKALDATFDEYSKREDNVFDEICEIFSLGRKEDNIRDHIKRLYAKIDVQPDRDEFFENVKKCFVTPYFKSPFVDVLEKYYKAYFEKLQTCLVEILPYVEALTSYVVRTKDFLWLCDGMLKSKNLEEMCSLAASFEPSPARVSPSASSEDKALVEMLKAYFDSAKNSVKKGAVDELKSIYDDWGRFEARHAQNEQYVSKLVEITCRFDEILKDLKKEDGVLSFEDLQHKAVELIRQYPLVASEFDAVYVDEYQDVNPTQEFIISHLVKNDCFMVGDVKQSIYGFRLADPTIFLSREQAYNDGEGVAISFKRNFRSAKSILEFVNGVFNDAMTKKSADVDYKGSAGFDVTDSREGGRVEIHLFADGDKQNKKTIAKGLYDITAHETKDEQISSAVAEGRFIASKIDELVGRAIGDGKYIEYGDVAILFRKRSAKAQIILNELKNRGIPVEEGSFGADDASSERELVCFLKTLDNPRQDIPFAGFLLSFFGGYHEEELAEIAVCKGDCLYDKFLQVANDNTSLSLRAKTTLKQLDDYRIKSSFKNVSQLLSGIVSDFSYDAYLMKEGESYVQAMQEFVFSSMAKDSVSIGRFLEGYENTSQNVKSQNGGDRVHVSTFHGFKGLEIPVVFVADCASSFNNQDYVGDLMMYGKGYIGMKYFDFDKKLKQKSISSLAVAKLIKQNLIKEEMRLFYVALTRAKQYMFITANVSNAKIASFGKLPLIGDVSNNMDFVSNAIYNESLSSRPILHYVAEEEVEDFEKVEKSMGAPSEKLISVISKSQEFEYSFKQATRLAMKYSVSTLDSIDDDTVRVFGDSAKIGTAYHKVMQFIDFSAVSLDDVNKEFYRLEREGILRKDELLLVSPHDIARCLQSEIMSIARECEKQGRVRREQSFMMYKPANEVSDQFNVDDKVLVQGVVDLFIDGKERIIVDFKNSLLKDEETVKKYKKQLYLYKMAIESAIGAKIDKVVLYSFKTAKTIEV